MLDRSAGEREQQESKPPEVAAGRSPEYTDSDMGQGTKPGGRRQTATGGRQTTARRVVSRKADPTRNSPELRVAFSPDDERVGDCITLASDVVLVGREAGDTGVSFDDPRMSRHHIRIAPEGTSRNYRFGDAGSANGTFLNGERISSAVLNDGDVLRLGDTLLVYVTSPPMPRLNRMVDNAATTDVSIVLLGETGTGKDRLARRIHERSGRRGDFVVVNCAALPRDLAAAELFGHARGAFSGAETARPGLFLAANNGTLFLDEIGDLPGEIQPALLRTLETRTVRPIGKEAELPVDVRIVAATTVDLRNAAAAGTFRRDLFARLAELVISVPPMRARKDELFGLLSEFAADARTSLGLDPDVAEKLLLWDWPYNVREVRSLVRSFTAVGADGEGLDLTTLITLKPELGDDPAAAQLAPSSRSPDSERDQKRVQLMRVLREHRGNISRVAKALGTTRAQVYRLLKRFKLNSADYRG